MSLEETAGLKIKFCCFFRFKGLLTEEQCFNILKGESEHFRGGIICLAMSVCRIR